MDSNDINFIIILLIIKFALLNTLMFLQNGGILHILGD